MALGGATERAELETQRHELVQQVSSALERPMVTTDGEVAGAAQIESLRTAGAALNRAVQSLAEERDRGR